MMYEAMLKIHFQREKDKATGCPKTTVLDGSSEITSQETEDPQSVSLEISGLQVTSQETEDPQTASLEISGLQVTSQETEDPQTASLEISGLQVTSQETDDAQTSDLESASPGTHHLQTTNLTTRPAKGSNIAGPQGQKAKKRTRKPGEQRGVEKKNKKQKHECPECTRRKMQNQFPYSSVLKRRVKNGKKEVLIRWVPCKSCGTKWKDSWEPSSFIDK
ncbi:uncharacterized protein [Hoplias malabaricus]|uniref:uncharacterized protein n=1 Tax=Hoplias malabaricus TaxID=27720 RepID=UPI0034618B15